MHRKKIPTNFEEAREALRGRSSRLVSNNTTLVDQSEGVIGLRLHSTIVVIFDEGGSIILNTGGWRTATTKNRLNRVARAHGWNIYAKAWTWYIAHRDGRAVAFEDGFTIPPQPREVQGSRLDVVVENHGTIFLVQPLSAPALDWLTEHTDGTWFGGALAVEHRCIADLVAGLRDEGFTVEAA